MGRNKYPEITVEKILEVSSRLFLEKGYENTTIQDIVDGLGGLTKGAVYHHFGSKEDIMLALSDRAFQKNNPFDAVKGRDDLNALQKMREAIKLNQKDSDEKRLNASAIPLLKNPRILAEAIKSGQKNLSPRWLELIEEGIADGSVKTEYPKEIAELIPFLGDIWLYPDIYPADGRKIEHKLMFFKEMLEKMGVPIIDDEIMEMLKKGIERIGGGD